MKPVILLFLIVILSLYQILEVEAVQYPIGVNDTIPTNEYVTPPIGWHQAELTINPVKPWYGMYLVSDPVKMNFIVNNHLNTTQTYWLLERVGSLSDANVRGSLPNATLYDSVTISPNSNKTITYSQQFPTGSWYLAVQLRMDPSQGPQVDDKTQFFVVQPMQDLYTMIGLIVSSIIGLGTVIALTLNVLFSKRHVKALTTQNDNFKIQNEDLKELTSIQNRPWIGMDNSSGSQFELLEKNMQVMLKNHGKTPALDVVVTSLMKLDPITEDEILEKGVTSKPLSIAPEEIFLEYIELPKGITSTKDLKQFYVGLYIKYKYEKLKEGKLITIVSFDRENPHNDEYLARKLQ